MSVVDLNDGNWKAETTTGLVLVDFFATWCGACQQFGPTVEQIADDFQGRVKVGKVDVDGSPGLSRQFNISYIPQVVLFKDNVQVEKPSAGGMSEEELTEMLNRHLALTKVSRVRS